MHPGTRNELIMGGSGVQVMLSRYSGQDDIVVGTPHMNRRQAELESVLGCFINTLAIRVSTDDAPRFAHSVVTDGVALPRHVVSLSVCV